MANWVEEWSKCPLFTLTRQTSKALIRTLRGTAYLTNDLLNEGYKYVLTARYQTDPLERQYSLFRSMSGDGF